MIKNKKIQFVMVLVFVIILISGDAINAQIRRALLVGINNYKPKQTFKSPCREAWWNLEGCINDVDAMQAILSSLQFGFKPENIHILKNEEATRERILTDLKKYLVDETSPGDICLFYYSGHGSRIKNSKSDEPDKMDETLVPSDWYMGVGDIRDKELKKLYNRVLNKKAHLTVIVDACHSGSISRGIPVPIRNRSLPPNECDTAEPPDNEKSPAERGALIFSAAQDFQAAGETKDENKNWHGLFTWAFLKVLQSIPMDEPAQNVLLKVKAIMQSEGKLQEPNLEGLPGKTRGSIWGNLTQERDVPGPLKVAVSYVQKNLIELQGGLALGIREDCELKKTDDEKENSQIRARVTTVHGFNRCTAMVIEGAAQKIKVGDCFTLDKWVAAREARMQVYVPLSDYSYQNLVYIAAKISELRNSGHIEWVEDPTEINPTHIISWHQSYWQLETLNESAIQPVKLGRNPGNALILNEIIKNSAGKNRTPRVFLQLPLSVEMARALGLEMNDYNRSVEMSSSLEGSHYILVGRLLPSQNTMAQQFNQDSGVSLQYAWVLPNMTQEPGQDFSLPVRTGWISFEKKESFQEMAGKLTDNILQLVRIRGWQQLVSPPGNDWFPYQLGLKNAETGEIKTTGPLKKGETYGLVLTADGNRLESLENIEKRYVYVFSIDSFGRGTLLFPRGVWGNAENYFPLTINDNEVDGHKQKFFRGSRGAIFQKSPPGEIKLGSKKLFEVSEPYGRDTFILLTTTDAISRPEVLDFSGVRKEEIIGLSPLEELLYDLNSEDRKPRSRPMIMNWSIARLPILSQPN